MRDIFEPLRAGLIAGLFVLLTLTLSPIYALAQQLATDVQPEGRKLALVIGNQNYRLVSALGNTKADAAAIGSKLTGKGYAVTKAFDLDRSSMFNTIETFVASVRKSDHVVIYYAGHGVELNGSNYLLPVDISEFVPESERTIKREAPNLSEILEILQQREAQFTLVIIDACRDNPLRNSQVASLTRSVNSLTRGLTGVAPARGTLVMYSAGIGEQALDKLSRSDPNPNGLFTRNLLELMDEEGLDIRDLNDRLSETVESAAKTVMDRDGKPHRQTPASYGNLRGKFFFTPARPKADEVKVAALDTACDRLAQPNAPASLIRLSDVDLTVRACESAVLAAPSEGRLADLLKAAREQQAFRRAEIDPSSSAAEA